MLQPRYTHNSSYCAPFHPAPLPLLPLAGSSSPLHIFPEVFPHPHPHPHPNTKYTLDSLKPDSKSEEQSSTLLQNPESKQLGAHFNVGRNENAETVPSLATTATDLPTPSLLFSHFTGRYWFPVLFFLLHVLVGLHLLLVQQAGSLEFTFLPDKLWSKRKFINFWFQAHLQNR